MTLNELMQVRHVGTDAKNDGARPKQVSIDEPIRCKSDGQWLIATAQLARDVGAGLDRAQPIAGEDRFGVAPIDRVSVAIVIGRRELDRSFAFEE